MQRILVLFLGIHHVAGNPCGEEQLATIQRKRPEPTPPAKQYTALPAGHFNWGVGKCMVTGSGPSGEEVNGIVDDQQICQELCDADASCAGYEFGTTRAGEIHRYRCCLETCTPPGNATAMHEECGCWVEGTVPVAWNPLTTDPRAEAEEWTYYMKVDHDADAISRNCYPSDACTSVGGDCCAPGGEVQSCSSGYPVSSGGCYGWWDGGAFGAYACCPIGSIPMLGDIRVEDEDDGGFKGGRWIFQVGGFLLCGLPTVICGLLVICRAKRRQAGQGRDVWGNQVSPPPNATPNTGVAMATATPMAATAMPTATAMPMATATPMVATATPMTATGMPVATATPMVATGMPVATATTAMPTANAVVIPGSYVS